MNISAKVLKKIDDYCAQRGLGQTAKVFLGLYEVTQPETKKHVEGLALLAEVVAIKLDYDPKAAFFGGLLHDAGKVVLDKELFDGHNITDAEYQRIKTHAVNGFEALKKIHLFTALCAGLHHNMYENGYGVLLKEVPDNWNLATVKKLLDIAMVISICDFINAFTNRPTKIRDGSDNTTNNLREMLIKKYPNDILIVDTALKANKRLFRK